MRRLIIGTAAVAVTYTALRVLDTEAAPTDPWVMLLTGAALTGMAVTMAYPFRAWTYRRVGLLFVALAFAVFSYGLFIDAKTDLGTRTTERLLDVCFSLLIVGAPMLLIGVVRHLWGIVHEDFEA